MSLKGVNINISRKILMYLLQLSEKSKKAEFQSINRPVSRKSGVKITESSKLPVFRVTFSREV